MNIKLKTLNITTFNEFDKRKIRFVSDIKEDPLVKYFVSKRIDAYFEESKDDEELVINNAYIITDNKKPVGFIRLARLNHIGELELHYGVSPNFRKKGYGTKILEEVGDYLLKRDVNKIKLDIKENNKGSIRCAEKANYHFERAISLGYDDPKVLTYVKERK